MEQVTEKIGTSIQNTDQLPEEEVNSVVGRVFLKTEIQMGHCANICWCYMYDKLEKLPTDGKHQGRPRDRHISPYLRATAWLLETGLSAKMRFGILSSSVCFNLLIFREENLFFR